VRSALGVQNPDLWINHLNIGNVMNLNPMMSEELINNSKTNPESSMTMETLLENCILFIVSAFCMGTEFRLLYQQQNQVNKLLLEQAERWHAKAVYYS
jgi:hypothetical protein